LFSQYIKALLTAQLWHVLSLKMLSLSIFAPYVH